MSKIERRENQISAISHSYIKLSYERPPVVNSHFGRISHPFSSRAVPILKVARVILIARKSDWRANSFPGQVLEAGK